MSILRIGNRRTGFQELAQDEFASIQFGNSIFYKNTVLYIPSNVPLTLSLFQRLREYVEPNKNIPKCTQYSLLYWIYLALNLPRDSEPFRSTIANREQCKRKARGGMFVWCCFGIAMFLMLGILIGIGTFLVIRAGENPGPLPAPPIPPPCDNETAASALSFLMNPPAESPGGAALMYYPPGDAMYYASANRGVILTGQYLWPIDPDTLVVGPNLYPDDYPWEDQITGMGYWANGNRFVFAERQYMNLWSTNITGGDLQHHMVMIVERRGIAIKENLAYLCQSGGQVGFQDTIIEVDLINNVTLRNISAYDVAGPIQGAGGITFHPTTGEAWITWVPAGVAFTGNVLRWIGTIDLETGECTRVCQGPVADRLSTLAFDGDGRLWTAKGGEPPGDIYRYNATGGPCIC